MEEGAENFRSRLVGEFRKLLSGKEANLPVDTDAVLVLSYSGLSEENTARTNFGVELVKKITATRLNLAKGAQPDSEQIGESGPILLLDGTPEQNADMARIARENGIPDLKIAFVLNPPSPGDNTKTQFEKN